MKLGSMSHEVGLCVLHLAQGFQDGAGEEYWEKVGGGNLQLLEEGLQCRVMIYYRHRKLQ